MTGLLRSCRVLRGGEGAVVIVIDVDVYVLERSKDKSAAWILSGDIPTGFDFVNYYRLIQQRTTYLHKGQLSG